MKNISFCLSIAAFTASYSFALQSNGTQDSFFVKHPVYGMQNSNSFDAITKKQILTKINKNQAYLIGKQIWHNECGGSIDGLTSWNEGEEFASLGIGHFIWYPENSSKKFVETFPNLIKFIKKKGKTIPEWLEDIDQGSCPWPTREDFLAALSSKKMQKLRNFLAETIDLQIQFIIMRMQKTFASIYEKQRKSFNFDHINKQIQRLLHITQGIYALIDYIHFKGEGLNPQETYKGHGWGLVQVLQEMRGTKKGMSALQEFCVAAKAILHRRVKNSPVHRNEQRWLVGWYNRIDTYLKPLF